MSADYIISRVKYKRDGSDAAHLSNIWY